MLYLSFLEGFLGNGKVEKEEHFRVEGVGEDETVLVNCSIFILFLLLKVKHVKVKGLRQKNGKGINNF